MSKFKEIYNHELNEDNDEGLLVKWSMDEKEHFVPEAALSVLLIEQKIFLNSNWFQEGWPEDAKKRTSLNVNCNDVFAWACADSEDLDYSELEDLFNHYQKDPGWGIAVWCIKKRGQTPQKPVFDRIQSAGIWDLTKMNLKS